MLKIEAYIRPSSLPYFHAALTEAGVSGISVWETRGIGREYSEGAKRGVFRGAELKQEYIRRVRIDTVVEDDQKEAVLAALKDTASKGDLGTLQIFVLPVAEAHRV